MTLNVMNYIKKPNTSLDKKIIVINYIVSLVIFNH